MKKMTLLLCLVLMMMVLPASAQEDEADAPIEATPAPLPFIPYFTAEDSGRKFNVPVPFEWEDKSTQANVAHFAHPTGLGEIYALTVDPQGALSAAETAIRQVLGTDVALDVRYAGEFQVDGNPWGKFGFTSTSATFTAFTQARDEGVYVLFYHYPQTTPELLMMAQNRGNDEAETALLTALRTVYPDIPDTPDSESIVTLSNGDWTRQVFGDIVALWQLRGGVVYIVVENGDGAVVDAVNKAIFTSLFGFFVTPQNIGYLWLGLAVTFGFLGIFLLTLLMRHRSLTQDEALVQELTK